MEPTIYNDVFANTYFSREHKIGTEFDKCFKNVD
jgi:hypothetical protein